MYIEETIVKDFPTNWNSKITIIYSQDIDGSEETNIINFNIKTTDGLDIDFSVEDFNIDEISNKFKLFFPYNKEFLISMQGKNFNKKNNIKFPEKNEDQLKKINDNIAKFVLKGDKNKFKDYLQLKTQGKDKFSSLKLLDLREIVGKKIVDYVFSCQFDEKYEAICYRWYLRGLPIDMSIRKVKTDMEISSNRKY